LHVLGLPPAFNLSHDQTLQLKVHASIKTSPDDDYSFILFLKERRIRLNK